MYSLALSAACSILFSLILTPVCRDLFRRLRVLDHPGVPRKAHAAPTPRAGGLPVILSYVLSFAVILAVRMKGGSLISHQLPLIVRVLPGVAAIFATGLLDDLLGLRPWQKLSGQFLAAMMAYSAGVRIGMVDHHAISPAAGQILTIIWLVLCSNAFNLIDGLDGLAAGLGLFATLAILIAGLLQHNVALALATAPLAGALCGFLRYNFEPATVFLGDSGSLLIGFLLGCYGVIWSQKSTTLLGMTAPLIVVAIPLLDVCLSVARRFLRRQPIFGADRGHIHHRLLDRGLTPRRAALVLYAVSGFFACLSLLASVLKNQFSGVVVIIFCLTLWLGIRRLNYLEFDQAFRMFLGGRFRGMIGEEVDLRRFQESLALITSDEEFWSAVQEFTWRLGFKGIQLAGPGEDFNRDANARNCWIVQIPLQTGGYLSLIREFQTPGVAGPVTRFVDVLSASLQSRCAQEEMNIRLRVEGTRPGRRAAAGL
jgi:UDP-GlcNAc:undecaprenyl-phosphate/decaprenyl-phosphate GlcNAc-1-phosphate transferase